MTNLGKNSCEQYVYYEITKYIGKHCGLTAILIVQHALEFLLIACVSVDGRSTDRDGCLHGFI